MRRGRRPLPSVAPGHHTAKGAVRGAVKAEAVAVGAVSPCDSRVPKHVQTAASCLRAKASVAPGGSIRSK